MTEAYNGLARKVAEVVLNRHGHGMAIGTIAATSDMKFGEREWTVCPAPHGAGYDDAMGLACSPARERRGGGEIPAP